MLRVKRLAYLEDSFREGCIELFSILFRSGILLIAPYYLRRSRLTDGCLQGLVYVLRRLDTLKRNIE
jgi:hypothetical protein